MGNGNKPLNQVARDKLQNQITDKMSEINIVCHEEIKRGLDYLEEARSSCYTESADTIEALLKLASKKFDIGFGVDSESIDNMATVAQQIHEGEMNNGKM